VPPSSLESKNVIVATPVLLLGGTEIQMLSMVRILLRNGFRVSVCCYYEYDPSIVEEFKSAGAVVKLLNLNRSAGTSTLGEIVMLFRALAEEFQSHRDSIVHVQYVAPGLVPILAAKFSGIRTVFATIHYPRHALGAMELYFVRLAARKSNLLICNSTATERSWFGSSKLYDAQMKLNVRHCTIYNSVDEKRISLISSSIDRNTKRKELGIGGEKLICVVGRLRSEKGHEFLFRAMVKVLHSLQSVRLLLVGDGPDKNRLQILAAQLGIEKSIIWAGTKTQDETFSLYGIANVVVVPSQFEGFSLTAAEAMAAGLPVVASDVGGLRDVVDDQSTGFLVSYNDVQRLSEALLQLLHDDPLSKKMGTAGRKKVERQFSLQQYEALLVSVYNRHRENAL
jgi:L-malate glycosyltransferase